MESRRSVSKHSLILKVGESEIPIELKRHLSPHTVGALLRSLPLGGNAHFLGGGIVYFESAIDAGIERPRKDFKRGDVAFYPAEGSVCFFTEDASAGKQMSPIGRIVSGIEELSNAGPGDILSLSKSDSRRPE